MPPPSSAQQKVLIAQFVSLTGVSERMATRYLKSTGFKINEAVDGFFAANAGKDLSPVESKLDAMFDSLRDDENDEKDKLELESTMKYLNKLNASLENAELFVVLQVVQAPSVGEITRSGYINGWKATSASPKHEEHEAYIRLKTSFLPSGNIHFKHVYKYAFVCGRERDQKALSLENALVYWGMLFSPPGMLWKSKSHDWLALWKTFLGEKWTRSVNKDMWNMVLEFALKSMSDETLSFWIEDGAWPSVIDDFVLWCRTKGIGKTESMDIDNGL